MADTAATAAQLSARRILDPTTDIQHSERALL